MASAYLSRTFGTPTNASKFTYSGWVKRSGLGASYILLYANGGDSQNFSNIMFNSADNFFWHILHSNSEVSKLRTNARLRDTSAWYHLVFQYDSTQATAADRTKMYINGVEVTSFVTQTNSGQNSNYHMNTAVEHIIGAEKGNTGGSVGNYFDGSLAHVHFVDGTIYAPSTFGETDATTGIWKPKTAPSVTYGNNGFFLKMDNSANMGLDSSGNSNNWTTSGTIIQNKDTPSNVFATMNPLHFGTPSIANAPLTDGNNNFSSSEGSGVYPYYYSTLGVSKGKYYAEFKFVNVVSATAGIGSGIADQYHGNNAADYSYYNDGRLYNGGSSESTGYSALSNGDILGCALDLDNNKIYFHINGSYQASGNPATGAGGKSITAAASNGIGFYHFAVGDSGSTAGTNIQTNFGNGYFGTTAVTSAQNPDDGKGIFEYDVPAGYRALCTESINAQEYS